MRKRLGRRVGAGYVARVRVAFHLCGALWLLVSCARTPVYFLAAPIEPTTEDIRDNPAGAVFLINDAELSYRVGAHGTLEADWVQRLQLRITSPQGATFAQLRPEAASNSMLLPSLARLTRVDGTQVQVTAPAGEMVSLPAPGVGDTLDFYLHRTYLLPQVQPPWLLAADAPTMWARMRVRAPPEIILRVVAGTGKDAQQDVAQVTPGQWSFETRAVPALPRGPHQPAPARLAPWVLVVPVAVTDQPDLGLGTTWATVAAWVTRHLRPVLALDTEAERKLAADLEAGSFHAVREVTQGTQGPLFGLASTDSDGISVGLALRAAALAAPWMPQASRVALATAAGGTPLWPDIPGLYAFTHALLATPRQAPHAFADPLCLSCAMNEVAAPWAGAQVLLLNNAGELGTVPVGNAQRGLRRYQFSWDAAVAGALQGSVIVDLAGEPADRAAAIFEQIPDEAGRLEALRDLLFEGGGPTLAGLEMTRSHRPGKYNFRLDVTTRLNRQDAARPELATVMPLDLAGDSLGWLPSAPQHDALLDGPEVREVTCTVAGPVSFRGNRFKPVVLDTQLASYQERFEVQGHILLYTRRFEVKARLLTPQQQAEMAVFAADVREAERKSIWVHIEE